MNTESLRVYRDDDNATWVVEYRGWAETPAHHDAEGVGQSEVLCIDQIDDFTSLAPAVAHARGWAEGSGFKIGPPKFSYGNVVEFKLRRP